MEALGLEARKLMTGRQQRPEARLRRVGPQGPDRDGVDLGCVPELQRPPAIAGRITIVSVGDTWVSRPSSTRTSSSLR
jgi:hypothetical protein